MVFLNNAFIIAKEDTYAQREQLERTKSIVLRLDEEWSVRYLLLADGRGSFRFLSIFNKDQLPPTIAKPLFVMVICDPDLFLVRRMHSLNLFVKRGVVR